MGKKQAIKSLANSIALVSLHKILIKHTKKLESRKHLEGEVGDYSVDAFEKSQEYKWAKEELDEIKTRSIKETENKLKKYEDIKVEDQEIKEFVIDVMQELLLKWTITIKSQKAMKNFIKKNN